MWHLDTVIAEPLRTLAHFLRRDNPISHSPPLYRGEVGLTIEMSIYDCYIYCPRMTALTKSGQRQESGQMAWIGCPFQSDMKLKHPSTGSTCSRKVE